MAITRDNPQLLFAGNPSAQSQTSSYTVGAGVNYLVVGISEWDGTNITDTAVTYNGVTMTVLGRMHATGDDNAMLFGLVAPAVGAHNVVVSRPGNNLGDVSIGAVGYSGVDQTTSTGTLGSAQGSDAAPTVAASSATGELCVAVISYDRAWVAGTKVLWFDESDQAIIGDEQAGASTTTFSWTTASSGGWAALAIPLKPASSGVTVSSPVAAATAIGIIPAIIAAVLLSSSLATASAAAAAPTVTSAVTIAAPVAPAAAAGVIPSVSVGAVVAAPIAAATADGVVPSVTAGVLVAAPAAPASADAMAPTVTAGLAISAPAADAIADAIAPTVTAGVLVDASAATATADCPAPTVSISGGTIVVVAPIATAVAGCPTPRVSIPALIENEWGRMLQSMVEKLLADYGPAGTTPAFRMVAAIHDEDEADDFAKSFPCVLLCFRFARVTNKNEIQSNYFASKAVGEYSAITYQSSGKPDDKAMFGKDGIHELEHKVRTSLMGFAPGSQAEINQAPLFWAATEPLPSAKAKSGSGLLKSRTTFTIDQLVTATAS